MKSIALGMFCCLFIICKTSAQISGTVFRDYNFNGIKDSSSTFEEPGVQGITIKLFDKNGFIGISLSDAQGHYSFNPTQSPPYRVEMLLDKPLDYETVLNSQKNGSRSSIRFVNHASNDVNFGINYPGEYCSKAQLIAPCYVSGDPLPPGSSFGGIETMVSWDMNNGGTDFNASKTINHGGTAPNVNILAKASQIGSCWGLAIQKKDQKLYSLATLKRHTALGPMGIGGFYQIDLASNTVSQMMDLNTIGIPSGMVPDNSTRGLVSSFPPISKDSLAFSLAAKVGYGGMDITEDEKTVYLVNLFNKKLYSIFIDAPYVTPTHNNVDSFNIPNPSCQGGDYRPWAVKVFRGKVYVGVVCDASVSGLASDLHATVYEFDPVTKNFTDILQFNLDYPGFSGNSRFRAWTDNWDNNCLEGDHVYCTYPQAILTDLEFDGDQHLILSIADRYGIQGAYKQPNTNGSGAYSVVAFGDILRATRASGSSMFTLEHNGNDGIHETAGKNTGIGPGFGEFYLGDNSLFKDGSVNESESTTGSIALCPGTNNVISTSQDPVDLYSSGVIHLHNKIGIWTKRYEIIPGDVTTFIGKSAGLGDIKLNTPAPPIQIGNYVWKDLNHNGIQDPIEPPLKNVELILYHKGVELARAISNEHGEYLFSNEPEPLINPCVDAFKYGIVALKPLEDYLVVIDTTQPALINFQTTPEKVGFPNNQLIDNNGKMTAPSFYEYAALTTDINGGNNFSIDFGFQPKSPCSIHLGDISTTACDPLTNSFNLNIQFNVVNVPIGNIIIELSTGEKAKLLVEEDGTYSFVFKNIESRGIQNVSIHVYTESDLNCFLDILNAFNQPISCCDHNYSLCSNRSNLINLTATPGMAQYRWFKSSDQAIVGYNESLVVDNNFPGLEDNVESYYFIAIDSIGDTIRQFCPYRIDLITCCALQVNTFFQTDCNNNGTVYNGNDDWFSILVNADNADSGPSSRYEVVSNGQVLGTAAYGAPIVVGNGTIPDFRADGITIYKVIIRDFDNHNCLDSIFTVPSSCPAPKITFNKSVVSYSILSDASYNIIYKIDVENKGTETGIYSLRDAPGFDDDLQIKTSFYTTNIPFKNGAALIGPGPWNIITNQFISPGDKHTFTVTINFSLDFRPGSSGDNIYKPCSEIPVHGESLFNLAMLDSDGDGIFDLMDTACANIPVFEIEKELIDSKQLSLRNNELTYRIIVRNHGGASGTYNLLESPVFDDDIKILNAQSKLGISAVYNNLTLPKPVNGWVLIQNKSIAARTTDTFYVDLEINLDLRSGSTGDNIYYACGRSGIPKTNEGLFNVAGLDLNNDLRPEIKDTSCNDLPSLSHEKFISYKKNLGIDSNEVSYLFVVRNIGGGSGFYSLQDKLAFDDDIVIENAQMVVNNGSAINMPGMTYNSLVNLVNNRLIGGFSVDSIYLTLKLKITLGNTSSGNQEYISCQKDSTDSFLAGQGLFNESRLDINQDGISDQMDTVCTDFEYYDLALRKTVLNSGTIKIGTNIFFRSTIFNQGTGNVKNIEITDYLTKAFEFNPGLSPGWKLVNDSILTYTIDSLASHDSVFIDLVLTLKQFNNLQLTINTSEISNFYATDNQKVKDIDSDPDQDKYNDLLVIPETTNDNNIYGKAKLNPNEDEDDQDVAQVPTFDIALKKRIAVPPPYNYNQVIPFKITLYNQGHATIYSSTIVDYIPSGYEFDPMLNPGWMLNNDQAKLLVTDSIVSGDTLDRIINLRLLKVIHPKDWVNISEVINASISKRIGVHALTSDLDSEFDSDKDNDMGGVVNSPTDDFILDDGNDSDGDGIKDEDDHDPAVPFIWDLALKKILITPTPHLPNQKLDFVIRIFNQGTDTLGQIKIKDYVPNGLQFFALDNPDWNYSNNIAIGEFKRRVAPGDSTDLHIFLLLKSGSRPIKEWINYAEILSSANMKGEDRTGLDIDSKEDSNNAVETNQSPFASGDDEIIASDISGNEDDHDPAMPYILDLALMKYVKQQAIARYEDTIEFVIDVFNQGLIPVNQFSLVDYIPLGMNWVANPKWNFVSASRYATRTVDTLLLPGDSIKLSMKLKINTSSSLAGDLVNISEISSARDTFGARYNKDIDSQFDFDKFNDVGGVPNSLSDNFINDDGLDSDGDGIMDEDDQDPAMVNLVDFALKKEITSNNQGAVGDIMDFLITVYNQGNVTASSISVVDYLTAAYEFNPNINPNWTLNGNILKSTKQLQLNPGANTSFLLRLKVLGSTDPNLYCNYAEINAVKDLSGNEIANIDADSNPNSNTPAERSVKPGTLDDNNLTGRGPLKNEDEDDHDVAGLPGKAKLGDMVWDDRNANGIMDPGEPGIYNVQVQLFDAMSVKLLKTTYTNSNGKYLFEDIPAGKYFVKFNPPTGCQFSPSDKSIDSLDSDITHTFGYGTTSIITLSSGDDDRTWDAGLYKCMFVDGYIWYDFNRDGILTIEENGINGIEVKVFSYPDRKLQSKILTFSNFNRFVHDGYYSFCLQPGSYYIEVQSLKDFVISPFKAGTSRIVDSDLDNSNGPFTSYAFSGLSKDSIRNINGGIYNPLYTLKNKNNVAGFGITQRTHSELLLKGSKVDQGVHLTFTGLNHECLKYVNIYRKEIQKNTFELLTTIQLPGETNEVCTYDYLDETADENESYKYWISALDENFSQIASNEWTQTSMIISEDIIISPNPTDNLTTIKYLGRNSNESSVEIRDMSGKLHFKEPNIHSSTYELNTSIFPNGMYYVSWFINGRPLQKTLLVIHK